ncbi:SNF2 helicase-associated domain-containing protein, partial [Streptomyces sp. NPDC006733]|uniref:SNF2 helicase-associated domain-containing protein n=1 Tax=Streptomyces sp. NPDC006733 TaxID=3155460 RepID=UPI0033BFFDE1
MAKVNPSVAAGARAAGSGGPSAAASLGQRLAHLGALAAGEAVFLPADPPRRGRVAFWTSGGELPDLGGEREELTVVRPHGSSVRRARVTAELLPVEQALPLLTRCRALGANGDGAGGNGAGGNGANGDGAVGNGPPSAPVASSTAFWGTAGLHALGLLARGRVLPGVSPEGFDAWRVGPLDAADHERLGTLAAAMPPEARAVAVPGRSPLALPAAEPLLRAFLDAVADSLTRPPAARQVAGGAAFAARAPQPVPEQRAWAAEVAAGRDAGLAVSLRLELGRADAFRAVVQLRSLADPSVLADAADLWSGRAVAPALFGPRAQVDTLLTLRRAARAWPPAGRLLDAAAPTGLDLSDDEARALLGEAAERLSAAGVAVHWPKELVRDLTAAGVLEPARRKGTQSAAATFLSTGGLLDFRWRVALGEQELTAEELELLIQAHRPIVRLRDQWVVVDPELVRRLRRAERSTAPGLTAIDALGAALTGSVEVDGEQVAVTAGGVLEEVRALIADPAADPGGAPGVAEPPKALA